MDKNLASRIAEYMSKCDVCTIATASAGGEPSASTVYFKNTGTDIYFNTGRDTQKDAGGHCRLPASSLIQAGRNVTKYSHHGLTFPVK